MESTEPFRHETLNDGKTQIRLIRCLPRTDSSSMIQCQVNTFDQATCPDYTALSYTWGPSIWTRTVLINGKPFVIRENLFHFMDQAMNSEVLDIDHIFIDQLCINQENISEVNNMVQRMPTIFGGAQHVIAWIGATQHTMTSTWRPTFSPLTWDIIGESEEKGWLPRLCQQTYWTRLWVVQELIRAREFRLVFDGLILSYAHLRDLLDMIAVSRSNWEMQLGQPAMRLLSTVRYLRFSHAEGVISPALAEQDLDADLEYVLYKFAHLDCHDRRDKVYGLLGTVRPERRSRVDYGKTAAEVFWAAVEAVSGSGDEVYAETFFNLGKSMGVTGHEDTAMTPLATEKFARMFPRKNPADLFAMDAFGQNFRSRRWTLPRLTEADDSDPEITRTNE